MYVILVPIQIKEGYKEAFLEAMLEDAKGSLNNEPGCLRFDVVQDASDPNRIWLYEVYVDEAAVEAHRQAPHFIKWRETVKDWRADGAPGGTRGGDVIWPPAAEWKK
ncbi:MAG: putative quinol monooxygenase [Caldilineaceae bacterium]